MANNTLTTMPESLRDLLNGLEEAHQADLSAEEQLQILKETNAARLAKLSSEEQQKYFKKAELEYKKQLRREKQTHEQELRALVEKYDADAKLGDEAFKAKHKISIKEYEARKKLKEKELKEDEKRQEKAAKQADQLRKAANKARIQQDREAMQAALGQAFGKGKSFSDRIEGVKALTTTDGKFDPNKTFGALMTALSDLSKQVDQQIDKISGYKSEIDTRLQGSNNARNYAGSY